MIALDCSAPATDPPVAPFGSGVKSVPHRGHQRKILTKGGSVTIEDIQLNSWKALPSGRVVGSVTNHPAGYLRYPAR